MGSAAFFEIFLLALSKHDLKPSGTFFWKFACELGFAGYVFHQNLPPEGDLATKLYTSDKENVEIETVYTSAQTNVEIEIVYTSDQKMLKSNKFTLLIKQIETEIVYTSDQQNIEIENVYTFDQQMLKSK